MIGLHFKRLAIMISAILILQSTSKIPYAAEPLRLSLEEAIRLAMKGNPDLLRAKARVEIARKGVLYQRGELYPYVGLSASASGGSPSVEISARQLLFRFGEIWPDLDQAREAEREELLSYRLSTLLLADTVRRKFWDLLITQEEIREREAIAAEIESRLSRMRERAKEGLVMKIDLLNVELELEEQRLKLNELKSSLALGTIELLRTIGVEGAPSLQLVGEIPEVRMDPDRCVAMGLTMRPEMEGIRWAIERQRRIAADAPWRWISNLSAGIGYGNLSLFTQAQGKSWGTYLEFKRGLSGAGYPDTSQANGLKAMISISLPLFDGFRLSNQIGAERLRTEVLTLSQRDLANRIEIEIRTAYAEMQIAKERVEIYRKRFEITKELRDTIDLLIETELGPEAGIGGFRFIGFDDAIRARTDFANAQDAYFAQRRAYAMAIADLYKAVGLTEGGL
jgi:outer membrane protein TolC